MLNQDLRLAARIDAAKSIALYIHPHIIRALEAR
jgi:hypothetical protein